MNQTENLLLDIANRMPEKQDIGLLLNQLKEIQKSINTCTWALTIITLMTVVIAVKALS